MFLFVLQNNEALLQNFSTSRRTGRIFFNQLNQIFNIANLLGSVGATINEIYDNEVDEDYDDIKARNCTCGKHHLVYKIKTNIHQ